MTRKAKELLLLLGIIIALGILFYEVNLSLKSPQEIIDYVEGFGAWGPVVIIILIIIEVIVAPVPGIVIAIGSGALFGPVWGTIYTYIGNVIGSSIAFSISRHFGRPFVKKLVREEKLAKYDQFFRSHGKYGLWIAYLFPVFPVDIISFVTGLSSLRFRKFFTIVSIAFIPNMLFLNYFGDSILNYGFSITTITLASVFIILFVLSILYMRRPA